MSNHKAINSDSESRREQSQGEATHATNCLKSQAYGTGCSCGAQTEGGEKPLVTCKLNSNEHTLNTHGPRFPCVKPVPSEPASLAAQPAGGARELDEYLQSFAAKYPTEGAQGRRIAKIEAYADQRVSKVRYEANKAAYEHYELTVAKLRQERDALKQRLADDYSAEAVRMERESRERAEKALREIADCPAEIDSEGRRVLRVSQADWKRALASLKSSEGAK